MGKKVKNLFIRHYKNKSIIYRTLSLFLVVVLIATFINIKLINANADNSVTSKPLFDIKITSTIPKEPIVGEDIIVNGKIIPKPFETKLNSQKKRIVLVLDTSGSMNDIISGWFWNEKTKLDELKKAASNFVDKMSTISNVEIGIVSYSDWGNINQTSLGSDDQLIFHDISYKENRTNLKKIINNLSAGGGTNTGDGLRKSEYALENYIKNDDKYNNQSIVFMTDGMPTRYCTGPDDGYYTEIDRTNHNLGGNGQEDWGITGIFQDKYNLKKSLNYAKKIGNIIKNKNEKRNIYSIGYGTNLNISLTSFIRSILEDLFGISYMKPNDLLQEIHESMGGEPENFYATDDNAIQDVFSKIADKIIESYDIKEVNLKMSFNENFSLNNGNDIKLNDIHYIKKSQINNIVKYEANPIDFSFIIKGKKTGKYNILNESNNYIEFIWEKDKYQQPFNCNYNIEIKDSIVPNINIVLDSAIKNTANPSDIIEIKYKIDTPPFEYNIVDNVKELSINDAKVHFDLGENYELIDNSILKKIDNTENQYILELPKISYKLYNTEYGNKIWESSSLNNVISFNIKKKPNTDYGQLGFGSKENNNLIYTDVGGNSILKMIETPVINYKNRRYLSHGIYNGVKNTIIKIDENTEKVNFVKGSSVYLAATFNIYNGSELELEIENSDFLLNGNIKIKKIDENGEVINYGNGILSDKDSNGKYKYKFYNVDEDGEDIVIFYTETFNETNKEYNNTITVDNIKKQIKLSVNNKEIPELF